MAAPDSTTGSGLIEPMFCVHFSLFDNVILYVSHSVIYKKMKYKQKFVPHSLGRKHLGKKIRAGQYSAVTG